MKNIIIGLISMGFLFSDIPLAKADPQVACAIWLCLPGGFPTGCASAYSEFKHRIKKGKPPLPSLASCTTGPDGKSSSGSYQMGIEYFLSCKAGFKYNKIPEGYADEIMCVPTHPKCNIREKYRGGEKVDCTSYHPERRKQTRFVKMWVDGQYLGQFFYE
ncbi:MAG: hypothetical protein KBD43_15215 [Saprospiraceae bacterium]|nr:hypothetical protein [Saprospiraceae bacterium]